MRKKLVFLLLLLTLTNLTLSSETITGEVITGEVTSDAVGVSIVVMGTPTVIITRPENKTYLLNNLLTKYLTSGNPDNVTYSIDGAANVTITGFSNITYNEGQRFLEFFVANGYGIGFDNVYFTINTSLLTINYTNYNGSTKGNSTDFYYYAYEDLLNLSDIILENTNYGKIKFNEEINVENDSKPTNNFVEINKNIVFGSESLQFNSSDLRNFNKTATISFYGVTYTNPEVLIDGNQCPNTLCTEVSYNSGTYIFNITYPSNYLFTLQEDTTQTPTDNPSGGGGGGGGGQETFLDLDIITPGPIQIGKNDQIVIPIIVHNNEESISFENIRLNATTTAKGIFPSFENIIITRLDPGENQTVMLFVESINAELGDVEIEIIATVENPSFEVSESLYLKTVETVGKVEVLDRIILAQEIFRGTPECLELGDLLIQAQKLLDQGNVIDSRSLVQEAILRCRELISNKSYPNPPNFKNLEAWRTPIEIAIILIIITLIIFSLIKRQKIDLKKAKDTPRKKGFWKKMFSRKKKIKQTKTNQNKIKPKTETLKPIEI